MKLANLKKFNAFAQNVRNLRTLLGISTPALAEKIGVTDQTVHNWIAGRATPSYKRLETITEYVLKSLHIECNPEQFLTEEVIKLDDADGIRKKMGLRLPPIIGLDMPATPGLEEFNQSDLANMLKVSPMEIEALHSVKFTHPDFQPDNETYAALLRHYRRKRG